MCMQRSYAQQLWKNQAMRTSQKLCTKDTSDPLTNNKRKDGLHYIISNHILSYVTLLKQI